MLPIFSVKFGSKSDILCIDSYVGLREIFKKQKDVVRVENETVAKVERNEEKNILKMELDAVTDLIITGAFDTEMVEETCSDVNQSKAENEVLPKSVRYKSNICLHPKKR